MINKQKTAKFIRVITVPPVMVLCFLLVMYFFTDCVFRNVYELIFSIIFLMIIPILAYPFQKLFPSLNCKGRECQRNLAFVFSFIGYMLSVIYGFTIHAQKYLLQIFLTYFLSVLILLLFNKVIKIRASGHACSIAGPVTLMIFLIGSVTIIPCLIIFLMVAWSSIILKRHTLKELLFGVLSVIIAFAVSYPIACAFSA